MVYFLRGAGSRRISDLAPEPITWRARCRMQKKTRGVKGPRGLVRRAPSIIATLGGRSASASIRFW